MILKRGDRVIMQFSIPGDRTTMTPTEARFRVQPIVDRITQNMASQGVTVIGWEAHSQADQVSILAVFRDEE